MKVKKEEIKVSRFYDGSLRWKLNGKLHREDGPAIIYPNGDYAWFKNNKLHREDGPVEIWNSYKNWGLNNEYYSQKEWFCKILNIYLK